MREETKKELKDIFDLKDFFRYFRKYYLCGGDCGFCSSDRTYYRWNDRLGINCKSLFSNPD